MMRFLEQNLEPFFAAHQRLAAARPVLELGLRLAGILGLYLPLQSVLRQSAHLPASDYASPVIALGLFRVLAQSPAALVLIGAAVALRPRALWREWAALEHGPALRILVGAVVAISAWTWSTYDFNLYFNQAHYLDRALLLLLAALVIWRPVFVFPFLWLLFALLWQFDYPMLGAYPWTEMNLVLRALALFAGAFLFGALLGVPVSAEFVFALICLIASFYWGSGLGKFQLDWISHPYLHYLILGAYSNGWLNVLPPATAVAFSQTAATFTVPLMVFTLVLEWGAILILLRRRLTLAFLCGFMAFHTGIFAYTGMLFWKWIALEAVLLGLLLSRRHLAGVRIFTRAHIVASFCLIAASAYLFRPTNLSWYDLPVSYTYQFWGVDEAGQRHRLPPATFTPYNDTLTLNLFDYTTESPEYAHLWAVTTDRAAAEALVKVTSADAVFAYEAQRAHNPPDPVRLARLDDFVRQFIGRLNERGSKWTPLSSVSAPRHLWTWPKEPAFAGEVTLVKVQIEQVTWLYAHGEFGPIRRVVVHEIAIPAATHGTQ